jgi:hypothetical protein
LCFRTLVVIIKVWMTSLNELDRYEKFELCIALRMRSIEQSPEIFQNGVVHRSYVRGA